MGCDKIEKAESSASEGALFKEDLPRKKVFQELWMNKHEMPPQKGRQLEAAADDTLMGRLASRMASRDMIDELDMGPKGRSPEAKKAQIADSKYPDKMHIEGPAIKRGTKIEREHTSSDKKAKKIAMDHLKEHPKYYNEKIGLPAMEKKLKETADDFKTDMQKIHNSKMSGDAKTNALIDRNIEQFGSKKEKKMLDMADNFNNTIPSKMMIGPGLHEQTADKKAFNMSDPIITNKIREGNNMAQQAKNAGNIFDTMHEPKHEQQKSIKK